nr:hypothetical protein Iba_chr14eCG10680 [Ipomoea batatas]
MLFSSWVRLGRRAGGDGIFDGFGSDLRFSSPILVQISGKEIESNDGGWVPERLTSDLEGLSTSFLGREIKWRDRMRELERERSGSVLDVFV